MVNKGSHVADFVRIRPHTYSTISAALMNSNNFNAIIFIQKVINLF